MVALKGWKEFLPEEWLDESVFAVKQDVKQLNEFVIHYTVERPLAEILRAGKLRPEAVDHFLPHYSSAFFRDKVAAGMEKVGFAIPQPRWFTNLETCGNTGSASIYIMLDELFRSGRVVSVCRSAMMKNDSYVCCSLTRLTRLPT